MTSFKLHNDVKSADLCFKTKFTYFSTQANQYQYTVMMFRSCYINVEIFIQMTFVNGKTLCMIFR